MTPLRGLELAYGMKNEYFFFYQFKRRELRTREKAAGKVMFPSRSWQDASPSGDEVPTVSTEIRSMKQSFKGHQGLDVLPLVCFSGSAACRLDAHAGGSEPHTGTGSAHILPTKIRHGA